MKSSARRELVGVIGILNTTSNRVWGDEQRVMLEKTLNHASTAQVEPGPSVTVETWLLRCRRGRWLTTSPSIENLPDGTHPHTVAIGVANERGIAADVVHSTSWRMVHGRLVVTYIVVTQEDIGRDAFDVHTDRSHDFAGTTADHTTSRIDPTHPPEGVENWEVVHHALHHLALLASTNASIAAALSEGAHRSLRPLVPEGAGILGRATRAG